MGNWATRAVRDHPLGISKPQRTTHAHTLVTLIAEIELVEDRLS